MKLLLPLEVRSQIVSALARAGRREIGGILMGEHVAADTFTVKEITIQSSGGAFAAFTRIVAEVLAPLRAFFDKTVHNYTRYNYCGEWHSHHSFALAPSHRDHMTMRDIVTDPQIGARFVVLLLVKLGPTGLLEACVTVYRPHSAPMAGTVLQEGVGSLPSMVTSR